MMKSRIHRPRTCRPKTQMATQRCFLSELCADSRCSLSIVDGEIKDTSTWHLSSKNTNGYTKMLRFRTMMWQNYNVTKSDDTFNTTLPNMITRNSFADTHTYTHTHSHSHTLTHTHGNTQRNTHITYTTSAVLMTIFKRQASIQRNFGQSLMTIFKGQASIQRNFGQSLMTIIKRQTSMQQNFGQSLMTIFKGQASIQRNFGQSLMTIFQDNHHFCRTLGSLWWQSLKDRHQFSGTLGSLWWQSFKTTITSAELWAVFDDNL